MEVSSSTTLAPTLYPRIPNELSVKELIGEPEDTVDISLDSVYKSLTVVGDEIIRKLDELLAEDLPDGIASLRPEDHTPEKTAERIVQGVTALLPIFAAQNPELEGEDLIESFMSTVKGGIEEGLEDAKEILGAIGALEVQGVSDGIDKTMSLVEEKLLTFEKSFIDNLTKSVKPQENENTPDTSPIPTNITA